MQNADYLHTQYLETNFYDYAKFTPMNLFLVNERVTMKFRYHNLFNYYYECEVKSIKAADEKRTSLSHC